MQGDEQEPDMRCGTLGTSGHVTVKSSICNRGVLYKSGVYASKVTCLTLGDLSCARDRRVRGELVEGRAIGPDRMGEVSRGHIRRWETSRGGIDTEDSSSRRAERYERVGKQFE